ncbi:MAG: hypothetical protein DRO88_04670 [Promethearchaeia archaeon]|nr:MAG: hypothetical protein DRO88_04670 [Candidatus Lokiarchaeia archaeon]
MQNPFEKFYRVWNAQELLDYAFSRASSKPASLPKALPNLEKVKRKEIKRMENATTILVDKITTIVKSVPNLDELPPFYRKLSHLLVDNDELRTGLGRINGVIPVLKSLFKQYRRKVGNQINAKQAGLTRMEFFGRCSSVIKKIDKTLIFLEECRVKLQDIPSVDLEIPSIVIAGYPNVGKSTLVGQLSSAKPQVSEYPFTTKQIYLGMYRDEYDSKYFQVIDTPGILDRPMHQRNTIEKQAILALNTISSFILFVFDPTPSSGYDISSQLNLYNEIRKNFADDFEIPVLCVINKIDLATPSEIQSLLIQLQIPEEEVFLINAKEGEHVDKLIKKLLEFMQDQIHF